MLHTLLMLLLVAQDPAPAPASDRFAGYPEQDAISYDLALDVDPGTERLSGEVRYRFRAAEPLDRIRLDAQRGPGWRVEFRDLDGKPLRAVWRGDQVVVELGERVAAGGEASFRAVLDGTPPDGFFFRKSRYGDPLAFTDHYSIRARGWLPCEDHPGDRASFELTLTYPAEDQAVASGVPIEEAAPGAPAAAQAREGRAVLRQATRSDIPPYLFAIVVGPYARLPEDGDARLWPHYVYREDLDRAKKALSHHAEWIRILERTFGPYAYGKYTVVQCPTKWGGFEAPGNVQLQERIFDLPSRATGTLAHELTHMWFGDAVGYAEWREVWLSEGFASYFGPWLAAQTGGIPFDDALRGMRARWLRSPEGKTKSIRWDAFDHPDDALNANTYPKGAWVLHMLRSELGDQAFFAALAAYYRGAVGTSVDTRAFEASIEKSTERELSWFFEQWLDRAGCPELRVAVAANAVAAEANVVVVEQVQDGEPYRFRLRLGWQDRDGAAHDRVFEVRERVTRIPIDGLAGDSLVVDPDAELLFRRAD